MSESNGKPNPSDGKITHRVMKRKDAKRMCFARYARDGLVYENGKAIDVYEWVGDNKTFVIEKVKDDKADIA